ncbi:MAG: 30S ribosomal protein S20 [Thermoanaerobaculia bacterium]
MANIKSAKKRIQRTLRERSRNRAERSRMRSAVKELRNVIAAGDKSKAEELLPGTLSLIDRTAQKKIIHRKAAARSKSRLVRSVKNISA